MRILYHHRTASKDGQAVHIEEMIEALRSLGHEVRIVAPVLAGDTLGVAVTITDKRETKKPDRGIVTYKHEVTNQRGELVLEATVRRMIKRAPASVVIATAPMFIQ